MNSRIQFGKETPQIFIIVLIVCLGLLQDAQAVSPAPDGWYGPPGYGAGNTAPQTVVNNQ